MAGPWEKYQSGPWTKYQPGPGGQSLRQGSTPLGFANRAIAGVLGGPVDLMDWALQPLGLDSDVPFGGSESIREGMEAVGAEVAPEGAQATTYSQRGMETLGAGAAVLLPGGAAVGALRTLGGPVTRAVAGEVAAPAIQQAGRFMGTEALAGYGAGVGGLAGERAAQEQGIDPAYGRIPGELLGGLAGVGAPTIAREAFRYTPAGMATEGVMKTVAPFTKAGAEARVRARVGGLVDKPEAIPGRIDEPTIANLTPAQRSREKGLLALDQRMRETDPTLAAEFATRNRESQRVLMEELRAPGKGATAADTVAYLASEQDRLTGLLRDSLKKAQTRADEAIAKLTPEMKETRASEIVREELEKALNAARAEARRLWEKVPDDVLAPTGATKQAYADALGTLTTATRKNMPEVAKELLDPNQANTVFKGEETVKELRGLMSEMRKVARQARAAGEANTARIADEIADAVLVDLDAIPDVSAPLDVARAWTREMAVTFKQGRIGKILGSAREGGGVVAPERTLEATLGQTGVRGAVSADELQKAVGDSPDAAAAMQQYLRKRFTESGDQGKFLRANDELLDRFPDLKREMTEAAEAGRFAGDVDVTITQGLKEAEGTATARFADAPIYREFETVVGQRVKNPAKSARALVRKAAKDPTGKAAIGLKAAALDYLIRNSSKGEGLSGSAIRASLTDDRIGPALREILNPVEMRRLARISNELDMIAASETPQPGVSGVMEDQVDSIIAFIGTTLGARGGAKLGGGVSGASLKTASAGSTRVQKILQGLTNNESERMLRDAALDNELYKMLFSPWTSTAKIRQVERRLVEYLAAETGAAAEELRGRKPAPPKEPAGPWLKYAPATEGPRSGLEGVDKRVLAKLDLLETDLGVTLKVNSGYRSPAENRRAGGAKRSQHLSGNALDIDVSGLSQDERLNLIRRASALGFNGIGVYKNSVHLDMGRRRAWGPSHKFQSVPDWAKSTIQGHMARKFKA